MVALPLAEGFASFLPLAAVFLEELPPEGFLMAGAAGLAFLAGVFTLGGGFACPRRAGGVFLGLGLASLRFIGGALLRDFGGGLFCILSKAETAQSSAGHKHYPEWSRWHRQSSSWHPRSSPWMCLQSAAHLISCIPTSQNASCQAKHSPVPAELCQRALELLPATEITTAKEFRGLGTILSLPAGFTTERPTLISNPRSELCVWLQNCQ